MKEHEIMNKGLEELNLLMISSEHHIQYHKGDGERGGGMGVDNNHSYKDNISSSHYTSTVISDLISNKLEEIKILLKEVQKSNDIDVDTDIDT
eukprot:gene15387-32563_t